MKNDIFIRKCTSYDKNEVNSVIANIFDSFPDIVSPGEKVLIKPNMLIAEDPALGAITHPRLIEAVCMQVMKRGAKPFIGDSSAFHSPKKVAYIAGLTDFTKEHNIPIVNLTAKKRAYISHNNKKYWFYISRFADQTDKIINLPKLKAHMQLRYTGAVKNIFGCVPGKIKALRHMTCNKSLDAFCTMLILNYRLMKPDFNIMDAIEALEEKGPKGGKVKKVGLIGAAKDAVALDKAMTHITRLELKDNPLMQKAAEMEETISDLSDINILSDVENLDIDDFIWPKNLDPIEFSPPRVLKSVLKMMWLNLKHSLKH